MRPEQELVLLSLELDKVKHENARLRKKVREKSRHSKRVKKAYDDALLLATMRAGRIFPSRDYAREELKMGQRRWQNAMGLLRMARIVDGPRRWITTDLPTITERLDRTMERAKAEPEAYRMRLNRHANHENG